jgi:hypothetical protein
MTDAKRRVIEALLDDVLDESIVKDAIDVAVDPSENRKRKDLVVLSNDWRRVLADDPTHARPIIRHCSRGG